MKTLSAGLFCYILFGAPTWSLAEESAQSEPEILHTSLSGALRIEKITEPSKDGEPATSVWVVSTKNPTQRAKIPKESSDPLLDDDEFNGSPNDEWIFGSRHAGSGLRDGTLYHCLTPLSIKLPNTGKSFNLAVWSNSVKIGALKRDYCSEGLYAMTVFVCWSVDSNRVLIRLNGGEEKRDMEGGLLYFNTRTNKFEVTDYLRKINKSKSPALVCAEPVDPLPSLADLKARYQKLDQLLNTTYTAVLAKTQNEYVSAVREAQRTWIKRRDEGANIYISLFPQAEREQRRLQFIGDVTAARIEVEPEDWISY